MEADTSPNEELIEWSWPRLIQALSSELDPERAIAARTLVTVLEGAFGQLREMIESANEAVSYASPSIVTRFDYPVQWAEPDQVDDDECFLRELRVACDLMAGGAELAADSTGKLRPMIPEPISFRFQGLPVKKRQKLFESWCKSSAWTAPEDFSDWDSMKGARHLSIVGFGTDKIVIAQLCFRVFPRVVDPKSGRASHTILAGIGWQVSDASVSLQDWNAEVQAAFWKAVSEFFRELHSRAAGEPKSEKVVAIQVERGSSGEGPVIDRFEVSTIDHEGADYLDELKPPLLKDSALGKVPDYALGAKGRELDLDRSMDYFLGALQVWATMLYPKDQTLREDYSTKVTAKYLAEICARLGTSPEEKEVVGELARFLLEGGYVRALTHGPSLDEFKNRHRARIRSGLSAGQMLLTMISCGHHHPEHLSVNKAAYLETLAHHFDSPSSHIETGSGEFPELPQELIEKASNPKQQIAAWAEYRSVAHLWAAWLLFTRDKEAMEKWLEVKPKRLFLTVFATSEALLNGCERLFAPGQESKHGPILDPLSTWRAPSWVRLPRVCYQILPLPADILDTLARYTARGGE